jgi:NADH-quinone oxidoreductase subunit L
MSDLGPYLWLIPGLPLLASALTTLLALADRRDQSPLRHHAHWPCILAVIAACVCSFVVFSIVYGAEAQLQVKTYYDWIVAGAGDDNVTVRLSLRADALSAMMLVMITFVGSLIAIYSIGYMHDDPGYPRFFAEIALFITAMTTLVLADNFILLYAGWEGVGLCSYLLIGFWFRKESASHAARKAFLVTRIGDVGLFLGIMLLWATYGSLDYETVFAGVQQDASAGTNEPLLWTACLLLFCGAAGKSAQFPLHVWLPDAMEGPTPVSALIHAATMVTAGVYLLARCTPLYAAVPDAQLVVACIGAFTALLAALIALTQNDLKRVLAYSTLSQLGYMFLALGCARADADASGSLVTFAVVAAMFHLFTHAFFKALLFLGAGSVMHAMGGVIDIRRFSGLRTVMPTTHWTFLCGALALAGFPALSGFWSKDEILDSAWKASQAPGIAGTIYLLLLVAALVTAALTAFYTFRAYFKTFHGETKIPHEAGHHAHESPPVMTVPLMVLAVFALGVGAALGPTEAFEQFLSRAPGLQHEATEHAVHGALMSLSVVLALGGIGMAWLFYVRQPDLPGRLVQGARVAYQVSLNKFYIDELYNAFILKPLHGLTTFVRTFDNQVVDALVDLTGHVPRLLGTLFRPVQNGLVQFYALAMVLGLTVFLLALVRSLL